MSRYFSFYQSLSVLFIFVFFSCGQDLTREDLLPNAMGAHGNIILLMEDNIWNGPLGEAVMYHLDQDTKGPALRSEPMFTVTHVRPEDLDHLGQMNRLLLKVMVVDDTVFQETQVLELKNYYAKGQLFVLVKDSDPDRLYSYIVNEFAYVTNIINNFELNDLITHYKKDYNKALHERAQKNYGISIHVPSDSQIRVDSANFTWVKRDRSRHVMANSEQKNGAQTYWIQQGILLWKKPYTDPSQLTVDGVLRDRDTVLKYHIPGKLEGSYMATEMDSAVYPVGKIFTYESASAVEIRGIWKHAGNPAAFGGGPFVQYTLHHRGRNEVVTVCVYIYGPNFEKREYIREADAMLRTIQFVD
ncbi:MAG: DUF4837 family protein [Crocinitomicaceae bacterium]|nr:DUF4837 family protein [Crocinitomicaceae bacterium]